MKPRSAIALAASILAVGVALGAGSIYAQDNGQRPSFAEMKQRLISRLTTELNCVQAATDEAALRACRPQRRGGPGPE